MRKNIYRGVLTIFSVLALAGSSQATTLYSLSTADISATPNTYIADSTTAGGGGTFSGSILPSNLTYANTSTSSSAGAYFLGKYTASTLTSVGDSITLNFTVKLTNFDASNSQAVRFGLFNVGTATTGAAGSGFDTSTGYRADFGSSSGAVSASGIRERTGSNANLFSTGISPELSSTAPYFTYLSGGIYNGSFTVTKTTLGVDISAQLGDSATFTVSDTASAFTTFNAFSIFAVNGGAVSATADFTTLTVSTVPEPEAWTMVFGGMALLFGRGLMRRRLA